MIQYAFIEMYIDFQVKMMVNLFFAKAYLMEPKTAISDE